MATKIFKFEDCFKAADTRKHLLLGNGFSIAAHRDFQYKSLLSLAQQNGDFDGRISKIFKKYDTTDFEEILRKLDDAAWLVSLYPGTHLNLRNSIKTDRKTVRDGLVRAVSLCHPPFPKAIGDTPLGRAGDFMSRFSSIVTINYDLLSYWAFLARCARKGFSDGFYPDDKTGLLTYSDPPRGQEKRIIYLHGALHLYADGYHVRKRRSQDTSSLISQIDSSLKKKEYPLFVSEGTWEHKKEKILSNSYLADCWKFFGELRGNIFIFGSSISLDSDGHLWEAIALNQRLKYIFVAVRGDPTSDKNDALIKRAKFIAKRREKLRSAGKIDKDLKAFPKLKVLFFDADSAPVWR